MPPLTVAAILIAVIALASGIGVVLRLRGARVRRGDGTGAIIRAEDLETDAFGARATLVQFSTSFCARCPAMHRNLNALATQRAGVSHIDVDLTHRVDLARRFEVLHTPTTLLLDGEGRVHARIVGAANRDAIAVELDHLLAKDPSHV